MNARARRRAARARDALFSDLLMTSVRLRERIQRQSEPATARLRIACEDGSVHEARLCLDDSQRCIDGSGVTALLFGAARTGFQRKEQTSCLRVRYNSM